MKSPSRRRLSGIVAACTIAIACFATAAGAVKEKQPGTFALYGGTQRVLAEFWSVPVVGLSESLKVDQLNMNDKKSILEYGTSFGKTAHFFIIRDDFATYRHYSADFNLTTGTLSHNFTREPNHKYWLYTDSRPFPVRHRQVFRFDIDSAGPVAPSSPTLSASPTTVTAGDYTVNLDTTTLKANAPHMLLVVVDQGGRAAENLTPEFGAAAIACMIDTQTLQFVSLHPTLRGQKLGTQKTYTVDEELAKQMENSQVGPNQQVELPALPAGTYKLWYEFIGGVSQNKHVAPFTIVVQ